MGIINLADQQRRVVVLVSTFNGARYLGEQLQSLWDQSYQDFTVVVRDDGSTDSTLEIVHGEASKRPGQIRLITDQLGRLGPARSFAALLRQTSAHWTAFCDQDDIWLPSKIERQVSALASSESRFGRETPSLCCGDAVVVDAALKVTHPSYFQKHNLSIADGRDLALPRLLFRNFAIGATTMMNASLAAYCRDMPQEAVMHDWWCALVARCRGQIRVLPEGLIKYRQHGGNAVGSASRPLPSSLADVRGYLGIARRNARRSIDQAEALARVIDRAPTDVEVPNRLVLQRFSDFSTQSRPHRLNTLLSTRAFKPGFALNLLHLYACTTA